MPPFFVHECAVEFLDFAFTIGLMKRWTGILWWLCVTLATASLTHAQSEAPASFFSAIGSGDAAEVTRQLDAGVSPDARDAQGVTALYLACEADPPQIAVARLLVERGANVNLLPEKKGRSTPLQVLIYRGFNATDLKAMPGYRELVELFVARGADVNASDVEGNTPLIAAAEKDDVETMKLLVKHGADMAHTNENGWTALERAVTYRRRTVAHEMVALGAPLDDQQTKLKQRYEFARKAGLWFPWIIVGSFLLGALMHRQFKALPKRESAPTAGDDLPKLQPLKCNACGGSASLKPGMATCSHCHEPVPVPEDYTETLRLRERTIKLLARAVKVWKRVQLVSVAPVRWALWIAAIGFVIYMWKGLFPQFVRDAFYDMMTFRGTMVWALGVLAMAAISIALAGYAIYLGEVRKTLPALPETGKNVGTEETLACQNCGGMVEMKAGDIVGICGYCGSETYRVALARQARSTAEEEKHSATVSLYEAMRSVYEMRENAALAIPLAIVFVGFVLVAVAWVLLQFI